MINVIGVKFRDGGKVYFFNPGDFELKTNDYVIVETARGMEFGIVSGEKKQVQDNDIIKPLKPVVRIADEKDIARYEENMKKRDITMEICQEKIEKHNLDMKLVDVEYTFDNNKIIFYFTADGRIDFRELVKDLAAVFKMRIELRQIGVRDEAKMLGGIGNCGRGICCHEWMNDFHPVSIKMAKTQNLSLNPSKISGVCGRLMCCLKYENDVYSELKKGMPNTGEQIKTDVGLALVIETNILEGKVKYRLIEEGDDSSTDISERLSSQVYVVEKGEFRRLGKNKRGKHEKRDDSDIEMTKEMKALLKE